MADESPIPMQIYQRIKQIFLLGDDGDRRLLQTFGLSVARFDALTHLATRKGLVAADLATLMLCDKANIARLLDSLERDGFVQRSPDETDGRRSCITLTPLGQERWAEAHAAYQMSVIERFGHLSPDEEDSLNIQLSRLMIALQSQLAST